MKGQEMADIKGIWGDEPRRDGEYPVAHIVGYDGVSSITEITQNLGEYGIHWFHVWDKDGNELARMNARYVASIQFEKAGA